MCFYLFLMRLLVTIHVLQIFLQWLYHISWRWVAYDLKNYTTFHIMYPDREHYQLHGGVYGLLISFVISWDVAHIQLWLDIYHTETLARVQKWVHYNKSSILQKYSDENRVNNHPLNSPTVYIFHQYGNLCWRLPYFFFPWVELLLHITKRRSSELLDRCWCW